MHADIRKSNEEWFINPCADTRFHIFVNNEMLISPKKLLPGDVLFVHALKIIWMGTFLQINNPSKKVTVAGLQVYTQINQVNNSEYQPVSDEDQNVDLYEEDDYFYHVPKIREVVEKIEIQVEPPPSSSQNEEPPFWMTIGPLIMMGSSSLMMGSNVAMQVTNGNVNPWQIGPQILMMVSMIVGALIIPRMMQKYRKKQAAKKELLRQTKYSAYLDEKEKEIDLTLKKQSRIMRDNQLSTTECVSIINSSGNRHFWSREIHDEDFLKIRLGLGNIDVPLDIESPVERFTLEEDNLLERAWAVSKKYEKLYDVPITLPLAEKNISAIICNNTYKTHFIDGLITQLVALHSANDLKIVLLTNSMNSTRWDYLKYSPHCISDDKSMRFFFSNS
jgi:S-DNA-T family DNA segregation ATPase FtsK/SpoIIIE